MADIKYLVEVDSVAGKKAVEDFDKSLDNLEKTSGVTEKTTGGLWKQVALGQFAYDAARKAGSFFVDFLKSSITEAGNAEKADKSLAAALEITGRPVKALTEHYKDFAEQMQKATTFEDDQVKMAQTLLLQLTNLDKNGIDRATKGAIGLASVMGMDLQSAAMVVEKAVNGNAGALSRYGIQIDTTKDKEAQRAEVLDKLGAFYARATADTETYSGRLAQLKNAYSDVQEGVGRLITENGFWLDVLTKAKGLIYDVLTLDNTLTAAIYREADAQKNSIERFRESAKAVGATKDEIHALVLKYKDVDDVGIKHERMLRDLIKAYPEVNNLLKKNKDEFDKVQKSLKATEKGTNTFTNTLKKDNKEMTTHLTLLRDMPGEHKKNTQSIYEMIPLMDRLAAVTDKNSIAIDTYVEKVKIGLEQTINDAANAAQKFCELFGAAFNIIDATSQQSFTNRSIQIENDYKLSVEKLKLKGLNEEDYQAGLAELDKQYDEKRRVAAHDAAVSQKKTAVVNAIISGIEAVAKAATAVAFPWNIPLMLAMGVLAAKQVSMIQAQPIPLNKGAIFNRPTLLPSLSGRNYEVAEPGSGGTEIVASPSNIRKAIGLGKGGGNGGGRPIYLTIHNYIAGQKVQEQVIKIIEDASQIGRLRISAKAIT